MLHTGSISAGRATAKDGARPVLSAPSPASLPQPHCGAALSDNMREHEVPVGREFRTAWSTLHVVPHHTSQSSPSHSPAPAPSPMPMPPISTVCSIIPLPLHHALVPHPKIQLPSQPQEPHKCPALYHIPTSSLLHVAADVVACCSGCYCNCVCRCLLLLLLLPAYAACCCRCCSGGCTGILSRRPSGNVHEEVVAKDALHDLWMIAHLSRAVATSVHAGAEGRFKCRR